MTRLLCVGFYLLGALHFVSAVDYSRDIGKAEAWGRVEAMCLADLSGAGDFSFLIGCAYDVGIGIERDPTEAVRWYKKGVEKGDVRILK